MALMGFSDEHDTNYRYERKLTCSSQYLAAVMTWIKCHKLLFSEAYPERDVNNIYLDTLDLQCYHDNLNGSPTRKKARIRWYGELNGVIEHPVLEFKIRKGLAGTKESYHLAELMERTGFTIDERLGECFERSSLPELVRHQTASLRATLMNRYRRGYYESADRRFRLTVDTRLVYFDIQTLESGWQIERPLDDVMVLELKYSPSDEDRAKGILQTLPVRLSRNSKYVNGIQILNP